MFEPTSTASDHSAALSGDSVMSPSIPWYVVEVEPLKGYRLRVKFEDGLEGEIHLAWRIFAEPAGIFGSLRDEQVFRDVFIDHGAVTWRNGMDIAPDASYDDIKRDGIQDEASWNRGEALAKAQMKAGKKIA